MLSHKFRDNTLYQLRSNCGMRTMPFFLGNIILLKEKGGMRESIPRQIDKKSRVPKEEKGIWGSQSGDWESGILKEEKRTNFFFFPSTFLSVSYITQFKLCTRDYTTSMYLAGGQFLLPENLLTNPDILECILW